MRTKNLHSWELSYSEATSLQKELARKIRHSPIKGRPDLIAGLDCAFAGDNSRVIAAVVVLKMPDFELVETATAVRKTSFPYIPGLLSFREGPACLAAVERLKSTPDLFIIDGQGIAHPRRLGLASHLGLLLDKPTIGCAKSRLVGTFQQVGQQKGSYSLLTDGEETIGAVVRTRTNVKPVFVSVGNKCRLHEAIGFILACTTRYRLPEPTRIAHQVVTKQKTRIKQTDG